MEVYRVAWRCLTTGDTGHGEYKSHYVAREWVKRLNKRYSKKILHWVESALESTGSQPLNS